MIVLKAMEVILTECDALFIPQVCAQPSAMNCLNLRLLGYKRVSHPGFKVCDQPFIEQFTCFESFHTYMAERQPSHNPDPSARHLRITDDQLEGLVDEYHAWRVGKNPEAEYERARRAMTLFLDFLGSGAFFRQVAKDHGCVESTAHHYCNEVAGFFYDISPNHVSLPNPEELQNLAVPVFDNEAILFVDGVIIPIQQPDNAGNAYYCGRPGKACHSLNVQIAVDKFGVIRWIVTGPTGASHDKTALQWSRTFMNFLENLPPPYVVIGDGAYQGIRHNLLTPFRGPLNQEQLDFNNRVSSARQVVERSIGALQIKWRALQHKENRQPAKITVDFACRCCIAAAVLHNRYTNYIAR